jgi:riboflavin biosynthesis pyrimidine reductase
VPIRAIFVASNIGEWRDQAGSSKGISNASDFAHLLAAREWADVIVSSGETVRANNYSPTKKPLRIISSRSRSDFARLSQSEEFQVINDSVSDLLHRLRLDFDNILVEFGPTLLREALEKNALDEFDLSITGDFDLDDLRELLIDLPFELGFSDYEVLEQGSQFTLVRFYL